MKKISLILALLISVAALAQERKQMHKKDRIEMSSEEMATLKSKKMALKLDLNENQQKELQDLFIEESEARKELMKERKAAMANRKEAQADSEKFKEKRFEMMNSRLDRQLAVQKKMKGILSAEQFETWKKSSSENKRMHYNKSRNKRVIR